MILLGTGLRFPVTIYTRSLHHSLNTFSVASDALIDHLRLSRKDLIAPCVFYNILEIISGIFFDLSKIIKVRSSVSLL